MNITTNLIKLIVVYSVILLLNNIQISAQDRGIGVKVKTADGQEKEIKLYKGSYALVIGNSDYNNGWNPLPGVKSDVTAVKTALENQGFVVETEMNLTKEKFKARMDRFIDDYGFNEPDYRLLIYYAGHGHTQKSAGDDRVLGYIVPVDAPDPAKDDAGFRRRAITMDDILNYAKQIQAKHAMFIFDSCFSGKLISRSSPAVPPIIQENVSSAVRQFITAGTGNQTVPDESIFRKVFIRGLEGEADTSGDGFITGSELGSYLRDKVTNYSERKQTPQYDKINDVDLDRGDFVFPLMRNLPVKTEASNKLVTAQTLLDKAIAQFVLGNADEAIIFATQAIELDNKLALAYAIRGQLNISNDGKDEQGYQDLEKASELDSDNPVILSLFEQDHPGFDTGELYLPETRAWKSIQLLKNPSNGIEYFSRGIAYLKIHKHEKAIADFTKAIELNPRFLRAYTERATAFGSIFEFNKALEDTKKALEINPNSSEAYSAQGSVYSAQGKKDLSRNNWARAKNLRIKKASEFIEANPQNALAYLIRANIYFFDKDFPSALEDYNEVIKLNPQNSDAYWRRSNIFNLYASYTDLPKEKKENYEAALKDYNKYIELNPQDPSGYSSRAFVYSNLGKEDLAEADREKESELELEQPKESKTTEYYTAEINKDPSNPWIYLARSKTYESDYNLAVADCNKAISLDENVSEFYEQRGQQNYFWAEFGRDSSKYDATIQDYSRVIEFAKKVFDPNLSNLHWRRADSYFAIGKYQEAIADYSVSIERRGYPLEYFYFRRGESYFKLNLLDKAIADYTAAIKQDNDYAKAYTSRAQAYEALGKKALAAADRKKAKELEDK